MPRATSTPSRPSADRVEDQRERIVDRGVAVAIVGAKAPVAQRAEDGAQDEERERIARDVAPDLSAGLRELHQRLDQLVRRLDPQAFPAGPHLEERAARDLASPFL